jgi:hypothetical protein
MLFSRLSYGALRTRKLFYVFNCYLEFFVQSLYIETDTISGQLMHKKNTSSIGMKKHDTTNIRKKKSSEKKTKELFALYWTVIMDGMH